MERRAQERRTRQDVERERRRHEGTLAEINRVTAAAIKAGEDRAGHELAKEGAADPALKAEPRHVLCAARSALHRDA